MANTTDLTKLLEEAAAQWGAETVQAIKNKISEQKIIWEENLANSIAYKQTEGTDITFNMYSYGKYQDEGTGIFGSKKTPIPKSSIKGIAWFIEPWASSKGLNAWAVATSIQRHGGIEARPFFKSTIEIMVPKLNEYIDAAYKDFMDKIVEDTNN